MPLPSNDPDLEEGWGFVRNFGSFMVTCGLDYFLAVLERHPLADAESVRWSELTDEDFVARCGGEQIRHLKSIGYCIEDGAPSPKHSSALI